MIITAMQSLLTVFGFAPTLHSGSQWGHGGHAPHGTGHHWGTAGEVGGTPFMGGFLWPLLGLLLVVAVAAGVYLLLRQVGDGATSAYDDVQALEALRVRYARGEIDGEEFEQRRSRLKEGT